MVKERIIKYIECDGCRKEIKNGKEGIVTFVTGAGERSYDLCCDCVKQIEDMLNRKRREQVEETTEAAKTIGEIKPVDVDVETRKGMIKPRSTKVVDNLGKELNDRRKEVRKRLQGLIDIGMTQLEIAKEVGIRQSAISKMLSGASKGSEESIAKLEIYFYRIDNERKQEAK